MINAVFDRELVMHVRTTRAIVLQALVLAGTLAVLVLLPAPAEGAYAESGTGHLVFRILGYSAAGLTIIVSTIAAAVAIPQDTRAQTMALLIHTPMTRWTLMVGKLASVLLMGLLPAILTLPAAAACHALGAVELEQLVVLYLVIIVAALQCAGFGLLLGCHVSNVAASLRVTFVPVTMLVAMDFVPDEFWQLFTHPVSVRAIEALRTASPWSAVRQVMGDGELVRLGALDVPVQVWRYLAVGGVCATAFLFVAALQMDHRILEQRGFETLRDMRSRLLRTLFVSEKPTATAMGAMLRRLGLATVLWDYRCDAGRRTGWITGGFILCGAVAIALVSQAVRLSTMDVIALVSRLLMWFSLLVIALAAPGAAGGLLAEERQRGGWELIAMAPGAAARLMTVKLVTAVLAVLFILLSVLPMDAMLPATTASAGLVHRWLVVGQWGVTAVLVSAAVGGCFSRPGPAIAAAYTVVFGGLFVLPLAVASMTANHSIAQQWARWSPPIASMSHIVSGAVRVDPLLALSTAAVLMIAAQVSGLSRPK